jgi:O-antigen/teichoic acid export membrane protein
LLKEFWSFAGPRGFASIFATFSGNINILLLGALFSAPGVTAFAAASRFMKLGTLALVAIFYTIAPQISGLLAKGRRDRAQAVYQVSTWWVMIGSWPVYFVLAVWAPFLMKVFPKGVTSGATALMILSFGMLVSMACGPVSAVLLMGGHAVWNLVNTAISLAVNVGLAFLLIPHFHVEGAAVATATAIALNNLLALFEVGVFMRLGTLGSGFGIVAAASGLCFGALGLLVRLTVGMNIATFVGFGVVSSLLYLWILMRFRDTLELQILWDTVVRRRRGRGSEGAKRRAGPDGDRRSPDDEGPTEPALEDELRAEQQLDDLEGPA